MLLLGDKNTKLLYRSFPRITFMERIWYFQGDFSGVGCRAYGVKAENLADVVNRFRKVDNFFRKAQS